MIKMQRLNVVKEVESVEKAKKLSALGFKKIEKNEVIKEAVKEKESGRLKADKKESSKDKKEDAKDESGADKKDNGGSDGQS